MLGIYCRTSNSKKDRYTIDSQKDGGVKCATAIGLQYQYYIDEGISGTLDESVRDGLSDLFRDIRKKKITHVYCIDQSRIERNSKTWEFFVAECLNNNVKYYPEGRHYSLDIEENRMIARLMSVVNSYYAEITSKKVRLANARKAKSGKTHGVKPFGYQRDENNDYIIFEKEAKYVRMMFEMSLEGIGAYTIANKLNELKVPTKFSGNFTGKMIRKDFFTKKITTFDKSNVKWRGNVISDMLRNKIYKGIREWNRHEDKIEYIEGKPVKTKVIVENIIYDQVPAIVKPELWNAVNKNLPKNKENAGRNTQYNYLLNGLITCNHCGNQVLGKKRLKGNDNSYKCKGKRPPYHDCPESRGISLPKLETFIIHHLFFSRTLRNMLIEAPKNENESTQLRKLITKKEKELIQLDKSIDRLAELLKDVELRVDTFIIDYKKHKKKRVEEEDEIEQLKKRLAEIENTTRNERTKSIIESFTIDVGFDEIKRMVHSLVELIEIRHVPEAKAGYYLVKIKYRGYDEETIFTARWDAMKWVQLSTFRKQAYSEEQMKEDREMTIGIMKHLGVSMSEKDIKKMKKKTGITDDELEKSDPYSENFVGREIVTGGGEIINLKRDELFLFDYPS